MGTGAYRYGSWVTSQNLQHLGSTHSGPCDATSKTGNDMSVHKVLLVLGSCILQASGLTPGSNDLHKYFYFILFVSLSISSYRSSACTPLHQWLHTTTACTCVHMSQCMYIFFYFILFVMTHQQRQWHDHDHLDDPPSMPIVQQQQWQQCVHTIVMETATTRCV